MKIINITFLLLFFTCLLPKISCAGAEIQANGTGLVVIDGQSKQLNLRTSYSPLQTNKGIYLLGEQQSQEKQKVNLVAFLSNDMQQEKYWPFERRLSTLFHYKENVYVLDVDGQVYRQQEENWPKASWHFPPYSKIISTEKSLLVCYSRAPLGIGSERGGCTAPEKNWTISIDFDWLPIPPQLCNDQLRISRFAQRPPFTVVQYNLDTGKKEWEKVVGDDIYDLCKVPLF